MQGRKIKKGKILSFGSMLDIKKWFKRRGVKYLLEVLSDVMKHVIIEDGLPEARR